MGTAPKGEDPSEPPPPPLEIKIGDMVLERYRVAEQIASGGHSVVFRGQDERLNRPVCIKVFSGLGGKSGVGRTSYEHFVQEAFALSRLTHPNTLRIYDFGHLGPKDAEGMPLQVCEYMNGGTLSNIVREQGKQDLVETARVIGAMCAALSEAHELGIVHRDIKPQNILFGTVGVTRLPKLADFGIAKWSADTEVESKRAEDTAIVAGQKLAMYSPSWAAPEQLAGQPVSAVTDIYSLACVAIYMLTGKAIFADEDVYAGYKKRRHGEELVKEALKPIGVPRMVIELLSKALAFDPKKRLARVEELADLMAALDPSGGEKPTAPGRRSQSVADAPIAAAAAAALHSAVTPIGVRSVTSDTTDPDAKPWTSAAPAPPAPATSSAAPSPPSPTPPAATPVIGWSPAPAVRTPWMAQAPVPQGRPHRLPLSDMAQQVGDRRVHFIHTATIADLTGGQGSKVRITFLTGPTGARIIHLKGMTCFVAPLGGRPSPAVQIEHASDISLVTPRAQDIGHIRVATGVADVGSTVFPVGAELVAIGQDDCTDAILFDFGPGSDAYFVYTRGRPIPKSQRRG